MYLAAKFKKLGKKKASLGGWDFLVGGNRVKLVVGVGGCFFSMEELHVLSSYCS